MPDDVDANGNTCTTSINLLKYSVDENVEIPRPDLAQGTYTENKQLNFTIQKYPENVKEIRYTTDGTEPTESSGNVYNTGTPIQLTGVAGESKTITVKVMSVSSNSDYSNSEVQTLTYTIELPAEKKTVTVINGTGSGEYDANDTINIIAEPESGNAFKNWIAEAVTYTTTEKEVTETILDENGEPKEITTTQTVTTRNAREIDGVFGDSTMPVTSLTVPTLGDGEILEVTAVCNYALTSVSLGVAVPEYGKALPTEISSRTSGVSVVEGSYSITPNDAAAKANARYTVSCDIAIDDGYVLGESVIFSVNGIAVMPIKNDDGTYTVGYSLKTAKISADVDGDGITDSKDAALVLRYISGIGELSEEQKTIVNVNGGELDLTDAIAILNNEK